MKIKRVFIPTLTALIIASQLCGCAAAKESELLNMINNQQMIAIDVAVPENIEQGEEKTLEWLELAYLSNYENFRLEMDDILLITPFLTGGKNGTIYTDLSGNHTNNSTLYFSLMNQKFRDQLNDTEVTEKLSQAVNKIYTDLNDDEDKAAYINAYFSLVADAEPNYFNGSSTLTRGEFLSALYKANTPVSEIEANNESLNNLLGDVVDNTTAAFITQILEHSYLGIKDKSLNNQTVNGTITRAEALYSIVSLIYPEELAKVSDKDTAFSDTKNGGDIASKQKFIESGNEKTYWKAYELQYAIDNADEGMPDELYKAMVVAKNKGIITGSESRWDEGTTKAEAIDMIVKAYEAKSTTLSVERGERIFTWEELCDLIVKAQKPFPDRQHHRRCRKGLADRSQLKDRVLRDRQRVVGITEAHAPLGHDLALFSV